MNDTHVQFNYQQKKYKLNNIFMYQICKDFKKEYCMLARILKYTVGRGGDQVNKIYEKS